MMNDESQNRSSIHHSSFIIHHSRPRAFTLIELLAVLVILGLLLATFIPYALSIRETANRTRCEKNLRDVYEAMTNYAAGNGYLYPRVRYDPSVGSRWTAFTGPDDLNPFAATSAVAANDVTASLWLLVREGLAQPGDFICPSGGGSVDRMVGAAGEPTVVKKRGNFRSAANLNYSYATPFSTMSEYRLSDTLPARFALVADRAPSEQAMSHAGDIRFDSPPHLLKKINSANHGGAGQNVLFADGSVSFETSPFCGVSQNGRSLDGDNIFTALAPAPLTTTKPPANDRGVAGQTIGPAYRYDTVLVPPADFRDEPVIVQVVAIPLTKPTLAATAPTTASTTTPLAATLPTTHP